MKWPVKWCESWPPQALCKSCRLPHSESNIKPPPCSLNNHTPPHPSTHTLTLPFCNVTISSDLQKKSRKAWRQTFTHKIENSGHKKRHWVERKEGESHRNEKTWGCTEERLNGCCYLLSLKKKHYLIVTILPFAKKELCQVSRQLSFFQAMQLVVGSYVKSKTKKQINWYQKETGCTQVMASVFLEAEIALLPRIKTPYWRDYCHGCSLANDSISSNKQVKRYIRLIPTILHTREGGVLTTDNQVWPAAVSQGFRKVWGCG